MPKRPQKATGTVIPDTRIKTAQKRLGYEFQDPSLLAQALCHASSRNEGIGSNERLEFLGDSVLNLLVTWFLYEGLRDADEGALSNRRARMTSGEALTEVGHKLKLGDLLRTGKGQDLEPTPNMEADAVEACIGAIFLDGGLEAAQGFVLSHIIANYKPEEPAYNDPKSRLQHYTLANRLGLPEYRLLESSGPAHHQEFLMEVLVDGKALGQGLGTSKKIAQQNAATSALEALQALDDPAANGKPKKKKSAKKKQS
jgi:ribonuclease-3